MDNFIEIFSDDPLARIKIKTKNIFFLFPSDFLNGQFTFPIIPAKHLFNLSFVSLGDFFSSFPNKNPHVQINIFSFLQRAFLAKDELK